MRKTPHLLRKVTYTILFMTLQKGSPYLDDFNHLMEQGFQMGFSWGELEGRYIPNGTKCSTWYDIEESHMIEEHEAVIKLENTLVTMGILAIGLVASVMVLVAEHLTKAHGWRKGKTALFVKSQRNDFIAY